MLGSINVKYRDVGSIWDVIIQALFYAVPIIYPVSMVAVTSSAAAKVILINPIAQVIQDVRWSLITDATTTTANFVGGWAELLAIGLVLVIFIVGALIFRERSHFFAEEV